MFETVNGKFHSLLLLCRPENTLNVKAIVTTFRFYIYCQSDKLKLEAIHKARVLTLEEFTPWTYRPTGRGADYKRGGRTQTRPRVAVRLGARTGRGVGANK